MDGFIDGPILLGFASLFKRAINPSVCPTCGHCLQNPQKQLTTNPISAKEVDGLHLLGID